MPVRTTIEHDRRPARGAQRHASICEGVGELADHSWNLGCDEDIGDGEHRWWMWRDPVPFEGLPVNGYEVHCHLAEHNLTEDQLAVAVTLAADGWHQTWDDLALAARIVAGDASSPVLRQMR